MRSPAELTSGDLKTTLRRTFKEFKADRATLISAGMAFYWFLAIFPGLLAAVGIFGLVNAGPQATESITKAIRTALPGDAAEVLTRAVDQAPGGGGIGHRRRGGIDAGALERVGRHGGPSERHGRGLRRTRPT